MIIATFSYFFINFNFSLFNAFFCNAPNFANYVPLSTCILFYYNNVYVYHGWVSLHQICDVWTSIDVLCCTSSILHLVAISMDRYWAVTRVDYIHNRSARRIFIMIALSWAISAVISIPQLVGWKDPETDADLQGQVCVFECALARNL